MYLKGRVMGNTDEEQGRVCVFPVLAHSSSDHNSQDWVSWKTEARGFFPASYVSSRGPRILFLFRYFPRCIGGSRIGSGAIRT